MPPSKKYQGTLKDADRNIAYNDLVERKEYLGRRMTKGELKTFIQGNFNAKALHSVCRDKRIKVVIKVGENPKNISTLQDEVATKIVEIIQGMPVEEGSTTSNAEDVETDLFTLPDCPANTSRLDFIEKHVKRLSQFDSQQKAWCDKVIEVIQIKKDEGEIPVGSSLNKWVETQRTGYTLKTEDRTTLRTGPIEDWKVGILEAIPGWVWSVNEALWEGILGQLEDYIKKNGHSYIPRDHPKLGYLVCRLRGGFRGGGKGRLSDERKKQLQAIGFSFKSIKYQKKEDRDMEMMKQLVKFWERSDPDVNKRHTNVPYPKVTTNFEHMELHSWTIGARKRYIAEQRFRRLVDNEDSKKPAATLPVAKRQPLLEDKDDDEEGWLPKEEMNDDAFKRDNWLAPEVSEKMNQIGFIWDPMKHYNPAIRVETRVYDDLKTNYMIEFTYRDKVICPNDPKKRRPDAAKTKPYPLSRRKAAALSEVDEHRHDPYTVEKEQKKVYFTALDLIKQGYNDIHLIRANVGERYLPDPRQQFVHAEIINGIFEDDKEAPPIVPQVTVHLLDWDRDHHHVKAYEERILPDGMDIREGMTEDDWAKFPLYKNVHMYSSGVGKGE